MNIPEKKITDLLDNLTKSNINFALYRLPWRDECHLVLQTSGEIEKLSSITELNNRRGFVLAPFDTSSNTPIVIIEPDINAFDWDEIGNALKNITFKVNPDICHDESNTKTDEDENFKEYAQCFNLFKSALVNEQFKKLVLSRSISIDLKDNFSPTVSFINACNSYPRMMVYMCHTSYSGTWIGSTPEIVINGHKQNWHTVALAGTMSIEKGIVPTEWSDKNKEEQRCVADYIREIIKGLENKAKIEEKGPYDARAGKLVHLKSDFFFSLKDGDKIGNILNNLHPTPAVCGLPKREALKFINENEGYDRKYYSGIVGWLDSDVETDLYINLRCMEIKDKQAILYAGGGIMASSELEQEWNETKQKLATMKEVIAQTENNN